MSQDIKKIFDDKNKPQIIYNSVKDTVLDIIYYVGSNKIMTNSNDFIRCACGFHVTTSWWDKPGWYILRNAYTSQECKDCEKLVFSINRELIEYGRIMDEQNAMFESAVKDMLPLTLRLVITQNDDFSIPVRIIDTKYASFDDMKKDISEVWPKVYKAYIKSLPNGEKIIKNKDFDWTSGAKYSSRKEINRSLGLLLNEE